MTGTFIHPSSVVEQGAQLGANVRIGPFCHVGPNVVLKDHVELLAHAVVTGRTEIGSHTRIFPMAVIGGDPQSVHHAGEETTLTVGARAGRFPGMAETRRIGVVVHGGETGAVFSREPRQWISYDGAEIELEF